MGRPAFLVDNLFNRRIYSGHTVTASPDTATGKYVEALSSGRRRFVTGGWAPSSLNADAYVEVVMDQARAFDCLWIDRDHNLAGETPSVRISDDGFTTSAEIGPLTVPAAPVPNSALDDGQIIMTDEGALLWYLGLQVAHEIRVFFPAMGSGERPEITGLAVGLLWRPEHAPIKPFDYAHPHLLRESSRSPRAQSRGSDVGSYRAGRIHLKCASFEEAATGEYPIEDLYLSTPGHGMVVVHDDERTERALLSFAPEGAAGFEVRTGGWSYPQIEIPIAEEDPVIR
jgi:hypothetical protein